MEYNTEINITDNLAQRFVEQGFAIKESEILSFIITNLYDYFITFASLSLLLVALFFWVVLSIKRKQEKDFDTKYRESRKDN